jgi:hypothetical protein
VGNGVRVGEVDVGDRPVGVLSVLGAAGVRGDSQEFFGGPYVAMSGGVFVELGGVAVQAAIQGGADQPVKTPSESSAEDFGNRHARPRAFVKRPFPKHSGRVLKSRREGRDAPLAP